MSDTALSLTLDDLIVALQRIRELHPDYADRPVHILDMEDDDDDGALVTHVEVDKFDDEQGPVVSLLSWPSEPQETGS